MTTPDRNLPAVSNYLLTLKWDISSQMRNININDDGDDDDDINNNNTTTRTVMIIMMVIRMYHQYKSMTDKPYIKLVLVIVNNEYCYQLYYYNCMYTTTNTTTTTTITTTTTTTTTTNSTTTTIAHNNNNNLRMLDIAYGISCRKTFVLFQVYVVLKKRSQSSSFHNFFPVDLIVFSIKLMLLLHFQFEMTCQLCFVNGIII